ncbi:HNH endonuclease [Xylanimonas protaetiae]|uniref:HNH endonuclease n=1 Tax=Xylanimonas protaetiae TaxID=2509457 RepID=A0A4P6F8F9_9MICO|nr:HNH endonuclease [Xylanimonas protaetiae]
MSWCGRRASVRGLCKAHNARVRAGFDPRVPASEARFFIHVTEQDDGCWAFDHVDPRTGYATFRQQRAHRWAYEFFHGPIPDGLHLDHLCANRRCVNPDHLDPVTVAVNNRRQKASLDTCKHGHPWTPSNTYIHPQRGHRQCRACRANASRRQRRLSLSRS